MWMFVILASHIAFSLFAVLNVVTGVFVDTACGNAARDKDEFLVNHISDVYKCELDKNGGIGLTQFMNQLNTTEMQSWLEELDVDKVEAEGLFHLMDKNHDNIVQFHELVKTCVRL